MASVVDNDWNNVIIEIPIFCNFILEVSFLTIIIKTKCNIGDHFFAIIFKQYIWFHALLYIVFCETYSVWMFLVTDVLNYVSYYHVMSFDEVASLLLASNLMCIIFYLTST